MKRKMHDFQDFNFSAHVFSLTLIKTFEPFEAKRLIFRKLYLKTLSNFLFLKVFSKKRKCNQT